SRTERPRHALSRVACLLLRSHRGPHDYAGPAWSDLGAGPERSDFQHHRRQPQWRPRSAIQVGAPGQPASLWHLLHSADGELDHSHSSYGGNEILAGGSNPRQEQTTWAVWNDNFNELNGQLWNNLGF